MNLSCTFVTVATMRDRLGSLLALSAACVSFAGTAHARTNSPAPLPTTAADFAAPGTQPGTLFDAMVAYGDLCVYCHAEYDPSIQVEPGRWRGSMHAHSAKDPVFLAAVEIANQTAPNAGTFCFRCHSPTAWVEGRVDGAPDGMNMLESDYREGISCHLCHRMVDPSPNPDNPPTTAAIDNDILVALGAMVPTSPGNGQYVIDPFDNRRGPFDLGDQFFYHAWLQSPFHQRGEMCGTCHNVSNPAFSHQPGPGNGTFVPNTMGEAHPTGNTFDMFPEQRTYSEWEHSQFAAGGVDMGGRFGGALQVVSQCQDCHMPDMVTTPETGGACIPGLGPAFRNDYPYHSFAGANRWILDAIVHLYQGTEMLPQGMIDGIDVAKSDIEYMLLNATDTVVTQTGADLNVRVINQCGHKLLTGMPEGRRIWKNVQLFDANDQLIGEYGGYDSKSAHLTENNTKVYECVFGIDSTMSAITGLPVGPSFYLVLNNTFFKDNRIPPRGFTNAAFASIGATPINYTYADGQHWDDTGFFIPPAARKARVRLYYQVASKEYIEFLRDANKNPVPNAGTRLYDTWEATGKSPPFAMDDIVLKLSPYIAADFNGDGHVNAADLSIILANFGGSGKRPAQGDANGDGVVNSADLSVLLGNFGT